MISFLYEIMTKAGDDLDACYQLLAEAGIEYPENDYNSKLLRNFASLYWEAQSRIEKEENQKAIFKFILEESKNRNMKLPEMKEKTQLDAVIEYMAQLTVQAGYQKQPPLWLPVLPKMIYLEELDGYQNQIFTDGKWLDQETHWELKAMVGFCDDPVNQFQMPLVLNFSEDGNHAVCGIGMSGKSTFLQTVIYSLIQSYSPEYLNLYILDFSSRMLEAFEGDVHVGGVLYESDIETVGKFFYMLQDMIRERKALFRGGNYEQYVRKNGMVCPAVVVVIDNMANFREKTEEKFDDILLQISRECTANGIYLLLSGANFGMSEIPGRLGENIRRVVSLEMQDKFAYSDVLKTMQIATLPESGISGRGLVETDGAVLEFQTCLAVSAADDYNRIEKIRSNCQMMSSCWSKKRARPIPFIPEKAVWSEFRALEETQKWMDDVSVLPMGYNLETAAVTGIDLKHTYCYLISGKARTGKTNLLRILMRAASEKTGKVAVVEFNGEELRGETENLGGEYIHSVEEFYTFIQKMISIFTERNALKMVCKMEAMEEEEIFTKMSEKEPYFIFISDLVEYAEVLHGEATRELNLHGALTNFQEKGSMMNIYFFAAFNWDKRVNVLGQGVYESFVRYKNGIHLGGYAESQSALEFQDIPFRVLSSADKAGCGIMTTGDMSASIRVVTPFARG